MKISRVKFCNYRNLDNVEIQFSENETFIIGENGIGKSNILNALNRVFINNTFLESDFTNLDKEIEIELSLSLTTKEEIGIFDDYVDPTDFKRIHVVIRQAFDDSVFKMYHLESGEEMSTRLLKKVNFIYYDSLRNPKTELSFEKERGSGSLFNFIIKYYLEKNEYEENMYIDKEKFKDVLKYINHNINKLEIIQRNSIMVNVDYNNLNFLNRVFQLYDFNNIELKKSSYGIQFSLLVVFSLFEKLIDITIKAKRVEDSLENINLILAFDEPEIHLHSFAQRALIKDLKAIANGEDKGFNALVNELFGIKSFSAQLIIVSHSDKIIKGNYENIVRLYSTKKVTQAVSGATIKKESGDFIKQHEKHLQKQFPFFCEALFAKKVLFVEGETELGAMHIFAKKMEIDLDYTGISIINAQGTDNMNTLIELFSCFHIQCLGIKDRDTYDNKRKGNPNYKEDKDDELIKSRKLFLINSQDFEFEIIESYHENIDELFISLKNLNLINNSIHKNWEECSNYEDKKSLLLKVLKKQKNITSGALLAELFTKDTIPEVYKNVLERIMQQ